MSTTTAPARALILAGGSGTRLWPRSTDALPKPFLALTGGRSLLRETFDRAASLVGAGGVYVSGRASHAEAIRRELPEVAPSRLVLEPSRRNTAPAIALSAFAMAEESDLDAPVAVLPSDQAVRDVPRFLEALASGIEAARRSDCFVTLGVTPTRPETGFGYLETAAPDANDAPLAPPVPRGEGSGEPERRVLPRQVTTFVEKPPLVDAERYVASGRHFWNAGIFVFRLRVLFDAMERFSPEVLAAARRAHGARSAGDGAGLARAFADAPSISFDYAVMEKAPRVFTVPCDCGWSDVGSWEAVYDFRAAGPSANVTEGPATVVGAQGALVLASSKPVFVLGLSDVAVVDAPEGLLVMRRGASDLLRAAVEKEIARKAEEVPA